MDVIPAIDVLDGSAVRLRRGAFDDVTVYAHDPIDVARTWVADGASLVHVVDLFATLAEIAGVDLRQLSSEDGKPLQIDGISLVPYLRNPSAESRRDVIYQDVFGPNGPGPYQFERRMVRDKRYKLLEFVVDGVQEFYDLEGRFDDGPNRIGSLTDEQRSAYERLRAVLEEVLVELDPAASDS